MSEENSFWSRPKSMFLVGLAIGLMVAAAVAYLPIGNYDSSTSLSPNEAEEEVYDYLRSLDASNDTEISILENNRALFGDLYQVKANVSVGNQSSLMKLYVTKRSEILFRGSMARIPPVNLDTGNPIGYETPEIMPENETTG
ncbi:MAG: hypothetical protein MUP58_01390 [Candidatus Nanohaloarchaeota archaeon QJJ-9]|nr:hypothetical protein [Candidatus Nanohaloarchaeota archaeon QJJ-9]